MKKTSDPWALLDLTPARSFFKQQTNEKGVGFEGIAGESDPNESESADGGTDDPKDDGGDTESEDPPAVEGDSEVSSDDPNAGGDTGGEGDATDDPFGGGGGDDPFGGDSGDDTSSSMSSSSSSMGEAEAPKTGVNPLSEVYTQTDLTQHIRNLLENVRETIDIVENISAKGQPVVVKGLRELEKTLIRLDEVTYVMPLEDCLPRYALAVQEYQKLVLSLKRLTSSLTGV